MGSTAPSRTGFRNLFECQMAASCHLPVGVGNQAGRPLPGARNVNDVEIVLLDQPIEMNIDEIQPGCRAPVAQQSWLDVLELQRFAQQWIGIEVDLPYGEIIRRAPV